MNAKATATSILFSIFYGQTSIIYALSLWTLLVQIILCLHIIVLYMLYFTCIDTCILDVILDSDVPFKGYKLSLEVKTVSYHNADIVIAYNYLYK